MCYGPVELFSFFPSLFCLFFTDFAFCPLFLLFCRKFNGTDIKLAGRDIYRYYSHFDCLAQTNATSRTLAYDALGLFVVFPLIGSQGGHPNESFNPKLPALNENAEARQAGYYTVELLTYFFAEHLQR